MPDVSLKAQASENLPGRAGGDALRRAVAQRYRFGSAVVAFVMLGLAAVFYICDLVRAEAATLWEMAYLGAVCWAFSHERELQRRVEDIRAGRDPADSAMD